MSESAHLCKNHGASLGIVLVLALSSGCSNNPHNSHNPVSPHNAIAHVGDTLTVCGTVASTNYVKTQPYSPTYLNLDQPYPNEVFTAIVLGDDRDKFSYVPESLLCEDICVTGQVRRFQGKAVVVIQTPSQITKHDSRKGNWAWVKPELVEKCWQ